MTPPRTRDWTLSVVRRRRQRQTRRRRQAGHGMEVRLERDYEQPEYEHPVDDINWTAGVGQPAGMYWLDGRIMMAAHGSPAEAHLLGTGAALIATLRFDADPLERVHHTGHVTRVPAARATRLLEPALN